MTFVSVVLANGVGLMTCVVYVLVVYIRTYTTWRGLRLVKDGETLLRILCGWRSGRGLKAGGLKSTP